MSDVLLMCEPDGGSMQFKVLMKKGNKPKAMDLAIPADARLSAALIKAREEQEKLNVLPNVLIVVYFGDYSLLSKIFFTPLFWRE